MAFISIHTVFNIDLDLEIAPFHKRLLAYMIDFAILLIYLFACKSILYEVMGFSINENIGMDILIISLPMLLYSLITEVTLNGQTIGKKLMAIRVVSLYGGEPTLGQYILRWITKFFEWPFLFGYIAFSPEGLLFYIFFTCLFGIAVVIAITVTKNSQRLGDLAAGTVVVDAKTSLNIKDTIFQEVANTAYQVEFPQVMKLTDSDINIINSVVSQARKTNNYDVCIRVQNKLKEVLNIESERRSALDFLEKLLEDYNYLATRE
ncbi:MAG TPA: RDD family protein [Ferruginibacter sp.]|jgi:uncharacterized RDD family membrane protein YckC|nr:RDD family protein [Bacteroidota bacterium]MCC6692700.1 RDD family protein [Chitinophagaceae bacterium]HMT96220.1 RDD family protein [Ferruginibacter sp.]MBS1926635.1 RDD family protein [Bacteroidota bacterium]HMU24445.1 RDD family protein [Ferruginibacter sp.]